VTEHYDVVIVGTSFAASFFLLRYLEHAPPAARILVLERGNNDTRAWQMANRRNSSIESSEVFESDNPDKVWRITVGFGGNSKCWSGGATRMMPGDFELRSRYGVGTDWPISYDDLELHYGTVERVMMVSGPADSPMPRSTPFPLPPHRFSDPEVLLKKRFPDGWYQIATARASVATGNRGACCATGLCAFCPVDAKFTIQNGLAYLYEDPRVVLRVGSEVQTIGTFAGVARTVDYLQDGEMKSAAGDLIVLGANAVFNPHILLRSGFDHPLIGRRLHEQMSVSVTLDLKGVKGYNGSTLVSGLGYLFYEGEHRRDHAACMIETWNSPFANNLSGTLRLESGRWNERMMLGFLFDDIPSDENTVAVSPSNPRMARLHFTDHSDYAMRGAKQIPRMLDKLSEALPIERFVSASFASAAHIQGTVVMGNDPATSVVDRHLIHHKCRNLLVLGSACYPTASPAYPTLTISALSLWAADHVLGRDVS
jgi:choline dehydrogenase-like flavoprotein